MVSGEVQTSFFALNLEVGVLHFTFLEPSQLFAIILQPDNKFYLIMEQNKLLLNTTLEEFIEALAEGLGLASQNEPIEKNVKKHYVYGLQGLSDLLGCSLSTSARVKKSGAIDAAISQQGKIIVIDADLALDLLNVQKKRKGGNRFGYKNSKQ